MIDKGKIKEAGTVGKPNLIRSGGRRVEACATGGYKGGERASIKGRNKLGGGIKI